MTNNPDHRPEELAELPTELDVELVLAATPTELLLAELVSRLARALALAYRETR